MAKRRHKIDPISLDEITGSPSLDGYDAFLRFRPAGGDLPQGQTPMDAKPIDVSPGRDTPIGNPQVSDDYSVGNLPSQVSLQPSPSIYDSPIENAPIGVSLLDVTPEPPLAESESRSVLPVDDTPAPASVRGMSTLPIGVSPLRSSEPLSPAIARFAETPTGLSVPGRRQKVHRALSARDGHSAGEHSLYEVLWMNGAPETPDTRLITIGYGGMQDLCRLDKSNCKKNVMSLIDKLAVEICGPFDIRKNVGNTYRVYSPAAVLRRRAEAGLEYVIRTSGVRFVRASPIGMSH
jgi:hypothetical protein